LRCVTCVDGGLEARRRALIVGALADFVGAAERDDDDERRVVELVVVDVFRLLVLVFTGCFFSTFGLSRCATLLAVSGKAIRFRRPQSVTQKKR
jgi:hypothetical protein